MTPTPFYLRDEMSAERRAPMSAASADAEPTAADADALPPTRRR